jgi:hypothetical protein
MSFFIVLSSPEIGYILKKVFDKRFDIPKPVTLLPLRNMAVVSFCGLIVIADKTGAVSQAVIETVFETMRRPGHHLRQLPQHHFPDSTVRVNIFGTKDEYCRHMVKYTIEHTAMQNILGSVYILLEKAQVI